MAEYILRNSLNPDKVVKCSITFRKITNKNEEGESIWLIQIATMEPHKEGGDIVPAFIHTASLDNIDAEVNEATEKIAAQVDWGVLRPDTRAPIAYIISPLGGVENVDINSDVILDIEDLLPAAGVDVNSIEVSVNDMDVTSELSITGDPYKYNVIWSPFKRVFDYYN